MTAYIYTSPGIVLRVPREATMPREATPRQRSLSARLPSISRSGALMPALPRHDWRAQPAATPNIVNALMSLPMRSSPECVYV